MKKAILLTRLFRSQIFPLVWYEMLMMIESGADTYKELSPVVQGDEHTVYKLMHSLRRARWVQNVSEKRPTRFELTDEGRRELRWFLARVGEVFQERC